MASWSCRKARPLDIAARRSPRDRRNLQEGIGGRTPPAPRQRRIAVRQSSGNLQRRLEAHLKLDEHRLGDSPNDPYDVALVHGVVLNDDGWTNLRASS